MKRGFVYLFALSALMALPSVAGAAQWKGVVVAKDAARQAFVTASRSGTMRTVRAPARFASLRVGAKVAVRGLRLSDGTFRSQSVRKLGRAKLALLDAVVVSQRGQRGRTILSGGGTVFSMRGGEHHEPGDEVTCLVKVKSGHHLKAVDCDETGHADAMKLAGIYLDASDGVLRIAVLKRGLVLVKVPDGVELPAYEPGDAVVLLVSIGEDGSFTLVSSRGDVGKDDDGGVTYDEDGVVVVGMYKGVDAGLST